MLKREDTNRIRLNEERIKHWMGMGAQATDRVALFLGNAGLAEKPKQTVTSETVGAEGESAGTSEGTS